MLKNENSSSTTKGVFETPVKTKTNSTAIGSSTVKRPPSGGLYLGRRKTPVRYNFIVKNQEDSYSVSSGTESDRPDFAALEEVDELEEDDLPSDCETIDFEYELPEFDENNPKLPTPSWIREKLERRDILRAEKQLAEKKMAENSKIAKLEEELSNLQKIYDATKKSLETETEMQKVAANPSEQLQVKKSVKTPEITEAANFVKNPKNISKTNMESKFLTDRRKDFENVGEAIYNLGKRQDDLRSLITKLNQGSIEYDSVVAEKDKNSAQIHELMCQRHRLCLVLDPKYAGAAPVKPGSRIIEDIGLSQPLKEKVTFMDLRKVEDHIIKHLGKAIPELDVNDQEAEVKWEQYMEYASFHNFSVYNFCSLLKLACVKHHRAKPFISMGLKKYFTELDTFKHDKSMETFNEIKNLFFAHFVDAGHQARAMLKLLTLCYRVGEKTTDYSARVYKEFLDAGLDPLDKTPAMQMLIDIFYHKYPADIQTFMTNKGHKNQHSDFETFDEMVQLANQCKSIPQEVKIPFINCPQCATVLTCKKDECNKQNKENVKARLGVKKEFQNKTAESCQVCKKTNHATKDCFFGTTKKRKTPEKEDKPYKKKKEDGNDDAEAKSSKEKREARKNGICFKCKSKWEPGHKCATPKHLGMMEIEEGEMSDNTSIFGSEDTPHRDLDETLHMVLIEQPIDSKFVKMPAIVAGAKAMIGIDSYASTSFMSPAFVKDRGLKVTPVSGYVTLAKEGIKEKRIGRTEPVPILVSGKNVIYHRFEVWDLPHQGVNILLGMDAFKAFGIAITGVPVDFPTEAEMSQ